MQLGTQVYFLQILQMQTCLDRSSIEEIDENNYVLEMKNIKNKYLK